MSDETDVKQLISEMATAIEGLRREREFLRAKLRDAAAREEREMEREMGDGRWERGGDDDDDSDEESPGGSAPPRNTPARQMDPRARAAPVHALIFINNTTSSCTLQIRSPYALVLLQ